MNWDIFFFILLAIGFGWLAYRGLKQSPQAFSKQNLSASAKTLGLLGVGLIGFVALLVLLVKSS